MSKKPTLTSNFARLEHRTYPLHMNKADVVILGAGPAGISAAIALGHEAIVLERRCDIGGLTLGRSMCDTALQASP